MTTNSFTGSVISTIIPTPQGNSTVPTSDTAPRGNDQPPNPLANDFNLPLQRPFVNANPLNLPISWDNSKPGFPVNFKGISINKLKDLISNQTIPAIAALIEVRYNVKSGTQNRTNFSKPTLTLYMWDSNSTRPPTTKPNTTLSVESLGSGGIGPTLINYCIGDNQCPSTTWTDISGYKSGGIFLNPMPWNSIAPSAGKTNYSVTNLTLEIEFRVSLTVKCSGDDLVKPGGFCPALCNENKSECFDAYLDYCFQTNNGQTNIFTQPICQGFFRDYLTKNPSTSALDAKLTEYCTTKYKGFEALSSSNSAVDRDLCGCHMQPEQYQNFTSEFTKDFDVSSTFGIQPRCLFPLCAASGFRTADIGLKCNVPPCLNIAEFNFNGTFDNNKVTISQKNNCPNIISRKDGTGTGNGDGDGNGTSDRSFWDKYKWIILGGSGLLLIIIILAIVIFAAK